MKLNTIHTIFWILSTGFFLASGCANNPSDPGSVESNQDEFITMQKDDFTGDLIQISKKVIFEEIEARGFIEVPPDNRAEISPYFGGYVENINLLEGQNIKKGELLFILRNPDYLDVQREWIEVTEKLNYLETDYKRQEKLAEDAITSQKGLKKAESDYKVMFAHHKSIEARLALMQISISKIQSGDLTSTIPVFAPISGYVASVKAVRGKYIDAREYALEIVNTDHLHLDLQVFEQDVNKLKEGQEIRFQVPESGEKWYNGNVHLIGKEIHSDQRTAIIHGHIIGENEENILPGMFVESRIVVGSDTVTSLPSSSIIEREGKYYVMVKENETDNVLKFRSTEVKIGISDDNWVQILKGLSPAEEVLSENFINW